jgi:DNA polymerase-3 subunit gamma/tau
VAKSPAPNLGFARKYRPQLFEEVVGQEAVAVTLKNAVAADRPAHAYLFFGPRGVGKTTSARILAKALNCHKGPTPKPCGKCPSCLEIAASGSIDVLELDAASNTQVDKIREMIIETVALAPSRDRFKIFIIDEVHMLSTSSFNALLKTLEEPPSHVVFILATTELAKLPATIVSRCQRFRFRPVSVDVTAEYLAKIGKTEKIKTEKDALRLLARAGGGALRDSLSLFDQTASYAGGTVTADKVRELVGMLPADFLLGIAGAVLEKDAKALTEWLGRCAEEGFDSAEILRDLRERFQELYLHKLGVQSEIETEWTEVADPYSPETFAFLLKRINRTLSDMRSADAPQLAFELGLYGMLEAAYDLREWVQRLEALEHRLQSGAPAAPAAASQPASSPSAKPTTSEKAKPAPAKGDVWPTVLEKIGETRPALAGGLGDAKLEVKGAKWKLIFSDAFRRDRAQKYQSEIEAALAAAGAPVALAFAVDASAPTPKAKAKQEHEAWVDTSEGEAGDDPGVKKVLGVLGGRVKGVRKKS